MVLDARTVVVVTVTAATATATTTGLQEDHSIQQEEHVAEAARTNCIDTSLPLCVASAFRMPSQTAKLG